MKTVALAAAMVLMGASASQAADVLDQANLGMDAGLNGVDHEWQQQITSGLSGRLSEISLWGNGTTLVRIAQGDAFQTGPYAFSQVVDFGPVGRKITSGSSRWGV